MSGFDAQRHVYWPGVAGVLPRPWPREAACMDLLWWVAEVRVFGRAFPSRGQLVGRWGWTDKRVRGLLATPKDWQDPVRPVALAELRPERKGQSRAKQGPDEGQTGASDERANADDSDARAKQGPSKGQARASEGPHARVSQTPCTPLLGVGTATATAVDLPTLLNGDHATIAALVAKRILTADDLAALTMTQLRLIHGIGPKRALTIRDALVAAGRDLTPEAVVPKRKTVDRPGLRDLTDRWCRAYHHVTGHEYRWTSRGRSSDQAAAGTIYDVVGWSETPTPEAEADAGGTIRRYLADCRTRGTVPTLTQLAAQLPQWRQTVTSTDRRSASDRRSAPRTIFEQLAAEQAANDTPDRILITPVEIA